MIKSRPINLQIIKMIIDKISDKDISRFISDTEKRQLRELNILTHLIHRKDLK